MRRLLDILRGTVEVEVKCRYPERFLNICAVNGVEYYDLRRIGETDLSATLHISDYRRLRLISRESGFEVRAARKRGAPFFLWRMRRRWALVAALAVCVLSVWTSSFFILEIKVSGNEKVSSGEILTALEELGVGIGTMRLSISQEYISNEVLQMIPDLSWIAVNCTGSRAEVLVREEVPKPEIYDIKIPADVVACKSGIITRITVLEGAALHTENDTVLEGEVLVKSNMDSISSGTRYVRASAEVWARTWYELSAQIPLKNIEKKYTGSIKTKKAIIFAGKRINLFIKAGNPWPHCDKITEKENITLIGGTVLPVTVSCDTYIEYEPLEVNNPVEEAEEILRERLDRMLKREICGGLIFKAEYISAESEGMLTVTLFAECEEQIGEIAEHPTQKGDQEEPQ